MDEAKRHSSVLEIQLSQDHTEVRRMCGLNGIAVELCCMMLQTEGIANWPPTHDDAEFPEVT